MQSENARMNLRRVKLTFAGIYFIFMSSRAIFGPFITVYLSEKGLSAEMIGIVTGINSLVIILSQPFWGVIADKIHSAKKTLLFCIFAQAVFAICLIFASEVFLISIVFCVYTSFSSAEGPLLDTWSLKSIKDAGDATGMGQAKQWGCIGFAISSIVAGLFISRNSASAIIPIFSAILFATGTALYFIKTSDSGQKSATLGEMKIGGILRDTDFLLFLVYIFVMQLAHRASYTFYPLLISQLGGAPDIVGYASAAMFVSEALIMSMSKRMLSKFRPEYMVVASSAFFVLWHVILRLATSPYQVVLSCILDGPSYALFTMGTLYYIDYLAPMQLRTTYQTIAYAVYFGLSGIIGNIGGGLLIDHVGYRSMYTIGIFITLFATAAYIAILRIRRGKRIATA